MKTKKRAAKKRKLFLGAAAAPLFLLALLAPWRAEASLERARTPELAQEGASVSIERALTLEESPAPEPRFDLFAGDELTRATHESAEGFHPLAAVSLLPRETASALQEGYPKTRVWVFDAFSQKVIGVSSGLSIELDWGSARFSAGLASDEREDPLGLLSAGEWFDAIWDATKQTGKDTTRVVAYGAAGAAVGAATVAAAAISAPVVVTAAVAVGGYAAVKAGIERWGSGQTVTQSTFGGVADATGATNLAAGVTDHDIATGQKLNLSHDQKVQALQGGAFAVGALYGGAKTAKTLDFSGLTGAAGRGLNEGLVVPKGTPWSPLPIGPVSTLKPGPYARESIPAHRGPATAAEQRQVNDLFEKHGCHTCGTKNPGTKSRNAIGDHQPAQALDEPKEFFPHCLSCARRQGGEVLQEMIRRQHEP